MKPPLLASRIEATMHLIPCPYCGPRAEWEFQWGGEAHRPRPDLSADDATWAQYLFERRNTRGPALERWVHRYGCGQWFHLVRDTVSHEVLAVYGVEDRPPDLVVEPTP